MNISRPKCLVSVFLDESNVAKQYSMIARDKASEMSQRETKKKEKEVEGEGEVIERTKKITTPWDGKHAD